MTDPERVEALAEVLGAHQATVTPELLRCACGWYVGKGASFAHAAHLAEAASPLLAEWRAADRAEALREAASEMRRAECEGYRFLPGGELQRVPWESVALWLEDRALAAEPDAGGDRG